MDNLKIRNSHQGLTNPKDKIWFPGDSESQIARVWETNPGSSNPMTYTLTSLPRHLLLFALRNR